MSSTPSLGEYDFVVAAFAAILFFGFSSVLSKLIIPKVGGGFQWFVILITISVPFVTLPYLIFEGLTNPFTTINDLETIILVILSSIFAFLGFLLLTLGFEKGNVSVGGVVLSTRVIFSVPLALLFIGERYAAEIYGFILLSFFGSILVSYRIGMNISDLFNLRAPGLKFFYLTSIFWAISNFLVTYIGDSVPVFSFLLIRQLIMTVFIWSIYIPFFRQKYPITFSGIRPMKYFIISYAGLVATAQGLVIFALGKNLTITEGIGVLEGVATYAYSLILGLFWDNTTLDEPLDVKSVKIRAIGVVLALAGTLGVIINI